MPQVLNQKLKFQTLEFHSSASVLMQSQRPPNRKTVVEAPPPHAEPKHPTQKNRKATTPKTSYNPMKPQNPKQKAAQGLEPPQNHQSPLEANETHETLCSPFCSWALSVTLCRPKHVIQNPKPSVSACFEMGTVPSKARGRKIKGSLGWNSGPS